MTCGCVAPGKAFTLTLSHCRGRGYSMVTSFGPARVRATVAQTITSRRDELVPLLHHVGVLLHHGVPAGDVAHALPEGAAVADVAGLFHLVAVGILDDVLGRLAFVPVVPFVLGEERLRRLRDG